MGWPTGFLLDASTGSPIDLNYSTSPPKAFISNTILAGNNTQLSYTVSSTSPTGWVTADLTNYFNRLNGGNIILATTNDVGLAAPFKYDGTVDFNAIAGSVAASGADFTNTKLPNAFFTSTTYRGAANVGDTWWKTWTRFN